MYSMYPSHLSYPADLVHSQCSKALPPRGHQGRRSVEHDMRPPCDDWVVLEAQILLRQGREAAGERGGKGLGGGGRGDTVRVMR